ncbi:hypothetical protein [Pseudomonas taetrolens]|uniref:hypothetical protein n=1 Tax=Pseudomonas taetrolens TaxID=47884 RepID=UPI0030D6F42B
MTNTEKQWDGLTISGELPVGLYYAGTRHKHFTLRVPLANDLIAIQEEFPQAPLPLVTMGMYHRQLLVLGDIPEEALTLDLLRAGLLESDLAVIANKDAELEKKLVPQVAASPSGAGLSTNSSNTDID